MNNQSESSTIMYTVIDGYTVLLSEDKQKAHQLLNKSRDVIKPLVNQFNGEWHKDTLSSFSSPVDTVNCALEIQRKMQDDTELNLRIGIHTGDIIYGMADGVKVASGIGPLAEPGGICISDQVYYAVRNQPGLETELIGEKKLENVDCNTQEIMLLKEEIKDLEDALSEAAAHQGMADVDLRRFDRAITRLETIVERLEKDIP